MTAVRTGAALAGCLALLVTASGCSSSGARTGSAPGSAASSGTPTSPAAPPSSSPPSSSPPPSTPAASEQAQIYAAALGERSAVASQLRRVTYLIAHFCSGMVDIGDRGPCRPGPVPEGMQQQLRRLVGPNLRITDNPPTIDPRQRFPRAVVVQFGTADVHDGSARLPVDYRCGPMCGSGDTLLLTRTGGRWHVTGHVGPAWTS
jgi:hypothetical protein